MSKPHILLIEDDLFLSELFSEILVLELDVEVEPIMDGQLALERLTGSVADVVLLDLHLPTVSGLDILHHIRADPRWKDVSVIVMSADDLLLRNTEEQASLTLNKPVSFEDLVKFVGRFTQPFNGGLTGMEK